MTEYYFLIEVKAPHFYSVCMRPCVCFGSHLGPTLKGGRSESGKGGFDRANSQAFDTNQMQNSSTPRGRVFVSRLFTQ